MSLNGALGERQRVSAADQGRPRPPPARRRRVPGERDADAGLVSGARRSGPYVGGIELFLARPRAPACLANGHQVSALTAHGALELPDVDHFDGIPIRRIDLFRAFTERRPEAILRCRRAVADVVADFAPDVVHLNPMGPRRACWSRRRGGPRRPVVVSIHAGMDGLGSAGADNGVRARLLRPGQLGHGQRAPRRSTRLTALEPSVLARSSIIPLGIPRAGRSRRSRLRAQARPPALCRQAGGA